MTRKVDYLLLGGGLAAATAAETLRLEGAKGSILLISEEETLPYNRPPLSKQFLLGGWAPEGLFVYSKEFYQQHDIEVRLGTRGLALEPGARILHTDEPGEIEYDKLLLATGATPNRLEVPNAELSGIHTLRRIEDALAIHEDAASSERAVIIGGSFLALELASTLHRKGIKVTVIEHRDTLFPRLGSPTLSAFFHDCCFRNDVDIVLDETVTAFSGNDRVSAVTTRSGRQIPCEMVIVAIGVTPNVGFLAGSGLALNDGIVVDRHLRSSDPHIFAAGDVANFFDPVFDRQRRQEHWDNAIKQGRLAARNMFGQNLTYDEVSYFFCDLFDYTFEFLGSPRGADRHIGRGSLDEGAFALLYLKDGIPRGVFSMGRPARETKAIEAMIRYHTHVGALEMELADGTYPLDRVPIQNVLILQGGGALGAFEAGVVRALEEESIFPDIVAGVSIGAFNGAIIAANPRHAAEALDSFWHDLGVATLPMPDEAWRRALGSWQTAAFGSPKFFHPRWHNGLFNFGPFNFDLGFEHWTSLYDTTPVLALLRKYVDFDSLGKSPVRLLVSAVNVETAETEIFDSYAQPLTAEHILASGSLPPAFPWTTVDGKHYWDGGIVSNSPLEMVIDRCGTASKQVIIVDLFPSMSPLPTNLVDVLKRRDEILYAERIRNDVRTRELLADFQKLVADIIADVDPATAERLAQRPRYIQLMGETAPLKTIRIARLTEEGEQPSRDYDFSAQSLDLHRRSGYALAKKTLAR